MHQINGVQRIRIATPEDILSLPRLETAADHLLETELGSAELPLAATVLKAGWLFVLVAGEPPLGFARVDKVDGQAHLEQLSVNPEVARRGMGRALLEAAVVEARRLGFGAMTLCTFADVRFNAPFYASFGFEEFPDPGIEAAALREHEADLGLDRLGRRVIMRLRL
ncbi:GNAT family N-acetyltransferase [Pseudarthrobacter sp. N5]|uniref:GNAT family N-acetyltransferase n=1 Tax=Pseudarthrobacter sp. N5 TaxID=3418416 RepID=UPI003CEFC234